MEDGDERTVKALNEPEVVDPVVSDASIEQVSEEVSKNIFLTRDVNRHQLHYLRIFFPDLLIDYISCVTTSFFTPFQRMKH